MPDSDSSVASQVLQLATFTGLSEGAAYLAKPKGPSKLALKLARKPKWEIPDRAMGPAWVTGFGLLGLSAYAAWRAGARDALRLWGGYLLGNSLFTRFGHDPGPSGVRQLTCLGMLGAYAWRAGRSSSAARWLALPFIGWLGYVALAARATRKRNPLLARFF